MVNKLIYAKEIILNMSLDYRDIVYNPDFKEKLSLEKFIVTNYKRIDPLPLIYFLNLKVIQNMTLKFDCYLASNEEEEFFQYMMQCTNLVSLVITDYKTKLGVVEISDLIIKVLENSLFLSMSTWDVLTQTTKDYEVKDIRNLMKKINWQKRFEQARIQIVTCDTKLPCMILEKRKLADNWDIVSYFM